MIIKELSSNTFWKGEIGIKGLVEDRGNLYRVELYSKGSQIHDYSCSCTRGNSYKGMCDHALALWEEWKKREVAGSGRPVTTSQEVRTMIREYTNREVAQIMTEGEGEKVSLVPRLLIGRNQIQLEFCVERGRRYIVKDLVAFSDAVRQGSVLEYGKRLSFHHTPSMFVEESQELLFFLQELMTAYKEHFSLFQKSAFATVPVLRQLPLGQASLDRFLEIVTGKELEMEDMTGTRCQVFVQAGEPRLAVKVRRQGKDGIRISIAPGELYFHGERQLYVANQEFLFLCSPEYTRAMGVFLEQMTQGYGKKREIDINEKDFPLFYERVLQRIQPFVELDTDGLDLEVYKPEELKVTFRFDSSGPGEVTMEPTLSYGDFSFHPVEDERLPRTVCRDVPGEFRISQLITKYFKYKEPETENLVIRDDEDAIYRLLTLGMEEFMAAGEVFVSQSMKQMKVLAPPKISVGVTMSGNWLDLSIEAGDMTGVQLSKILAEYTERRPYYRLKTGEFIRLDDDGLMTVSALVEELGLSKNQLQNKEFRLPAYRTLYLDSILKEGKGLSLYRDQTFKSIIRGMKSVEDSDFEIPDPLKSILRGYQKTGFRWLKTLDSYGFGGILADDMGLGKTIQIIALLQDEADSHPDSTSLIVCPASLVYNWESEIHRFSPSLKVLTITGTGEEREEKIRHAAEFDVVVTSYDLLKRDITWYESCSFRYEVIDEAQNIKNASTQSAKAVKTVNARTRFALTGTPIENRLSELWSIFDYLMPGFLFSYQRFRKEYENPVIKNQEKEVLKRLHRMIGPFVLRRLKKDVLKELPDKLELVIHSQFEAEQKRLYSANAILLKQQLEHGGKDPSERMQILAQLTKLRQICCDPSLCYENYKGDSAKLETCLDLVRESVGGGHKLLLFSQFTTMLDRIGSRLKKEGIAYHMLTGATSKEERQRMVHAFHKDQVPVFLISLKAGGTGLNLTAADIVIHYDPWWNVAAQNQATDRAYRIGQEKQVTVYKLIARNTIEENILKLQEAKQNLSEEVIYGTDFEQALSFLLEELGSQT